MYIEAIKVCITSLNQLRAGGLIIIIIKKNLKLKIYMITFFLEKFKEVPHGPNSLCHSFSELWGGEVEIQQTDIWASLIERIRLGANSVNILLQEEIKN